MSFMDSVRSFGNRITGNAPPPEPATLPQQLLRQIDEATTLTWRQRAIGFGICFGLGIVFSFLSLMFLTTLALTSFAVLYSIGSILSLASTMFLMGPKKQCQNMFDSGRWIATVVYLGAIAATLAVAFTIGNFILVIVFLIIQFLAMIWYCITYIPGGQGFLKSLIFRS